MRRLPKLPGPNIYKPTHKACLHLLRNPRGFTLIEIIITLVICGIASAMLSTYIKNSLANTNEPITVVTDTLAVYSAMERIKLHWDLSHNMQNNEIYRIDLNDLREAIVYDSSNPSAGVGDVVTNDFGTYQVNFNFFVEPDASDPTLLGPATNYDKLLINISDSNLGRIRVTDLFWE